MPNCLLHICLPNKSLFNGSISPESQKNIAVVIILFLIINIIILASTITIIAVLIANEPVNSYLSDPTLQSQTLYSVHITLMLTEDSILILINVIDIIMITAIFPHHRIILT